MHNKRKICCVCVFKKLYKEQTHTHTVDTTIIIPIFWIHLPLHYFTVPSLACPCLTQHNHIQLHYQNTFILNRYRVEYNYPISCYFKNINFVYFKNIICVVLSHFIILLTQYIQLLKRVEKLQIKKNYFQNKFSSHTISKSNLRFKNIISFKTQKNKQNWSVILCNLR